MKNKVIILLSLCTIISMPASAMQMYKCSLTHNVEAQGAEQKVEIISDQAIVFDSGSSFAFFPDGKTRITSPELHSMKTASGETVLAGSANNLTFVKLKDSYVLRKNNEGYVFSDCVKTSK